VETPLRQALALLTLTENTVQGCRILIDAQKNPEMDEDLARVLAHILESKRVLRYLIQAARRAWE
jgi:hypothetical protein